MILEDFVKQFICKNTIIRLWYPCHRGHEMICEDEDEICMEWQLLGGLFRTYEDKKEYKNYNIRGYVNVYKLVLDYRKMVNPKVNVYSIQTAGYNNVLLPQNSYRCSLLTGWTGKEISYAHQINTLFDELDKKNS